MKPLAVGLAVLVGIVLLLILPVRVPRSVSAVGVLAPSREWQVVRLTGGRLEVTLYEHAAGTTRSILIHQFEREDAVSVELLHDRFPGGFVSKGDTLAFVHSADLALQLAELDGSLGEARASLDVFRTGEKSSIVQQAREDRARARADYEGLNKTRERARRMFGSGALSQQELDEAERAADAAAAAVASADARVKALSTGAKDEQVRYSRSLIESLARQRSALDRKLSFFCLQAPFTGKIYRTVFSDTLIRLGDPSSFVVVMNVPWTEHAVIHEGAPVSVAASGLNAVLPGRVVVKSDVVQTRNGRQVTAVVAQVSENTGELTPGLPVSCTMDCGDMPLREWLLDRLGHMLRPR